MKPKSKVVTFDSSWFALLPASRKGDYRFMYEVAKVVKRKGIKRGDLEAVRGEINKMDGV